MEFINEEYELDIQLMESINEFETSLDLLCIECANSYDDNVFIESTLSDFKDKVSKVIKQILESLKKFFKDVRVKISTKVQQIQLNRKLEELKDMMAKKRSKVLNKKINYFDVKKYKQYYSDFINRYVAELKSGLNKDFKSVEEYECWRIGMLNKLADFNYKLSDEEQWKLSITINSAVKLSEEEARNREKNLKMVEDDGSSAIKGIEKYYKKIDTENSFVNYDKHRLKIFKLQNSFIGFVCSKIAQCIKTIVKFITKHTFACITTLLVILIAA